MSGMYPAQAETDHSNTPKIWGDVKYLVNQTIFQDAGRSGNLLDMTLMAQISSSRKWVPLQDVDPALTPGKLVCGTLGATLGATSAVSDGSFGVQVDGETALQISALDFSEIETVGDTSATAVCAALGANLGAMQAVTDGGFKITIDGTEIDILGLDWSAITALDEVSDTINYKALGRFEAFYDSKTTFVWFRSLKTGALSTITALTAPSAGTDVSGSGFLNGASATLVQGVGSDGSGLTMADVINAKAAGRFEIIWDGVKFTLVSPTLGSHSAVSVLTAGVTGTDISGAGFMNGLTGTGTATAGTGGDGSEIPTGLYRGGAIAEAAIIAGDTSGEIVVAGGLNLNEDDLVLENSLDLDSSIITSKNMTIRAWLRTIGIYPQTTKAADAQL